MSKENKDKALNIADKLCNNHSAQVLQQVASTLFQRTLEMKTKNKWSSAEDDVIRTFFYLTSKEEMCEALQCTMESLYNRARTLGVVRPSFQSLTAMDIGLSVQMFSDGLSQNEVLNLVGIDSVAVPVKSLTIKDYDDVRKYMNFQDSAQMGLFDED